MKWVITSLPGKGAKYCDRHVYISVCLSVRMHISKTTRQIFKKIFCMWYLWPAAHSFSDGSAIRYVLPVLWMTHVFTQREQMGRIRDHAYVSSSSSLDGGTGRDVCRLRSHLVN